MPPLYTEICSPLIAGEVKWFTHTCRHSAPAHPGGTGAAGQVQWGQLVPAVGHGAPSPGGAGQGKRDVLSASSLCISLHLQRAAAEVVGLLKQMASRGGPVVERVSRCQETVTEIRTFIAKGAGKQKAYASSGRNGVVEKMRKEIKAVGEVSAIKGGNLGERSSIRGKYPAWL